MSVMVVAGGGVPELGFGLAIQKVIYDKLTAMLAIPVYDDVPQPNDGGNPSNFPYVTLGEDVLTFDDTDTINAMNASITVHVWSRHSGRKEVKEIQNEIYHYLHRADLVAVGYNFVTITQESATTMLDADGLTRHGVQTFKILIEEI